ncbi:Inner membrane protein YhjD [Leucobacter soli]|uniref:Inner membrane protein YhjD n=1 Tax=Leucobacter soli TaxID=2812850 RepID=A0A916JV87_9MICO|nr:Inner membrane protein YhjD [Leucobacter soli]
MWQRLQRLRPWRAWSHLTDVGGSVLSAGMSYQAVFAVFAALWVGFGVFGTWLRGNDELLESLVEQINRIVPGLLGDDGVVSVATLLGHRSLDWTSAVAAVSLLWVTITWFTGTRRAIRIIFGLEVKQYRNAVLLKLRDLLLALIFLAALVVSAALTVLSTNITELLFDWLGVGPDNWLLSGLGVTLRYSALFLFDVLILFAIHWLLAEIRIPVWALLRGCVLGGAALFGLKILGAALLGGASSNPLLASFAVIVGLLIWFNLVCRSLLLTAAWIATGQDRTLGAPEATA